MYDDYSGSINFSGDDSAVELDADDLEALDIDLDGDDDLKDDEEDDDEAY